ncbi:hypothetical protein BD769DRAFT_1632076 [Suillus cothurnatus]|nr:hypothetical protein BD769DRAFT_1632076 [Suillus cothurnatus]
MPTPAFSQVTPYISNSTSAPEATSNPLVHPPEAPSEEPRPPLLPSATKTEIRSRGTCNEQLNCIIQSKYEAVLLKPWMDRNVSRQSKQQILQPLSAVAQSLCDIGLVFIEEAFERLLLDYDHVFSAGCPSVSLVPNR